MSQFEKLLAKFLEYPEWLNYLDVVKILKKEWFKTRQKSSSHLIIYKWKYACGMPIHDNDCKLRYKKDALKMYIKYKKEQEENEEEE